MPIYKYTAYGPSGASARGSIEAEGPRDAAARLKAQGFMPRSIEPEAAASGRGLRAALFGRGRMDESDLPILTSQLAVLLRSGVPLVEALRAASEERTGQWRQILVTVRERVAGGASLSRALDGFGDEVFPEFYRHMVAAGEESGTLDRVLQRLSSYLASQQGVREKVRTASIYPMIMAGVAALVLVLLFTFVIPKIVGVFENSRAALPWMTVALIAMSRLVVGWWWALLVLGAGLFVAGRAVLARNRMGLHRALMRPLASLYLARLTRTLGFLLEGGLPITRAMELAGRATGNAWLRDMLERASERVTGGAGLSSSLEGLPPVLTEMISTGERGGRVAEVLGMAADSYEADFDRMVQRGLALIEPAMILAMAVVVGFIVFAVLLPMFQMNQLIQ
jgi:general secretion pathway protein F